MVDVTVDEVAALLGDLEGDMREGRRRLIEYLQAQGYSLAELQLAIADDRLVVLPIATVLREALPLSASDVAAKAGAGVGDVLHMRRVLGLPAVSPDEPAFDEETCAALASVAAMRSFGVRDESIDRLVAAFGQTLRDLALQIMTIFGEELARRGDTEYDAALRYEAATRAMVPLAAPLLLNAFNAQLLDSVREIFMTPEETRDGVHRAVTDMTIAFIDVAGFTDLGVRVDASDLKAVAARLATMAAATLVPPVRFVKSLGDAVMLVSREPAPLVDTVVKIRDEWERAADASAPLVHIGIAKGLSSCSGADVYGAPVNLASRVTAIAPPGSVWVTSEVADAVPGRRFVPAGEHTVKGVAAPLGVLELERAPG